MSGRASRIRESEYVKLMGNAGHDRNEYVKLMGNAGHDRWYAPRM